MTATTAAPGSRPLVLRNVTIVDTRDGTLAPGLDVLIADGVIREITTSDPARGHRRRRGGRSRPSTGREST